MPNHRFEDKNPEKDPNDEPGFAQLFESYMKDNPELHVGDKINGKIITIGSENVFVDTGTKTDGVVEKKELLDQEGNFNYRAGDRIELYVISITEDEIRLSGSISGAGNEQLLYDAYKGGIPVEGRVIEECKGGFRVNIMKKTAFCPISQIDHKFVDRPEEYLDQNFNFLITRFEKKGRNIVVSRRELQNREIEAAKKAFFKTVKTGDILDARVTKLMPYGVFAEIQPGVEGMIHVSELSWSRLKDPAEIVKTGDLLRVKVLDIKTDENKLSLSAKQVDKDPWETVTRMFQPGDKISGRVTRCADFGAFVEISPGIEGLVHISEISYTKRVLRTEDVLAQDETVSVMIKEIDPENRRVSLSIKDAEGVDLKEKKTTLAESSSKKGLGDLGEKLKAAIDLKKNKT